MTPKSGTAGTAVIPTDPTLPHEADKADPGEMSQAKARQLETKTGKYGAVKIKPFVAPPPAPPPPPGEAPGKAPAKEAGKEPETTWIAVTVADEKGKPFAGERYEVVLDSGEVMAGGTLDDKGSAHVAGIKPGQGTIRFPNLPDDMWKPK